MNPPKHPPLGVSGGDSSTLKFSHRDNLCPRCKAVIMQLLIKPTEPVGASNPRKQRPVWRNHLKAQTPVPHRLTSPPQTENSSLRFGVFWTNLEFSAKWVPSFLAFSRQIVLTKKGESQPRTSRTFCLAPIFFLLESADAHTAWKQWAWLAIWRPLLKRIKKNDAFVCIYNQKKRKRLSCSANTNDSFGTLKICQRGFGQWQKSGRFDLAK